MQESLFKDKIKKILIANRSEIVGRIAKTAKKMGIKTVSVFSDADKNSFHRHFTDESYHISGVLSSESYMNMDKLLNVIKESGCDAVHPGFGFLSEKAEFPIFLEKNGVRFIGPPPESMKLLGSKIESKIIAKSAGVNIIPGVNEPIRDSKKALDIAKEIGFPVMIKASAGGGGKGMRIAFKEEEFIDAFEIVMSESIANYKDDNIFIEKFIQNPRHIEIQVIADKAGNAVYLNERECSIQRRNQKIIEEAPSPFFLELGQRGEEIRAEMGRQSVELIKKIGYYSVATVEFVVDQSGNFYFLEVNTRIQVEHPITEESVRIKTPSGFQKIDLVEWMIRIENGEELNFSQDDVCFRFHSIEARIYAENPEKNFIPSIGKIEKFHFPEENENLRIETGIRKGSEISPYYDPMIAKICAVGENRAEAIHNLKKALASTILYGQGLVTNLLFLEKILMNENFLKGDFSTNFINLEFKNGFKSTINPANPEERLILQNMLIGFAILSLENIQFLAAHNLSFFPVISKSFYITFLLEKTRYFFKIHIIKQESDIKIVSIDDLILSFEISIIQNEPNLLGIKFLNQKQVSRKKQKDQFQETETFFKYINLDYNKIILENNSYSLKAEIYSEKEFESFKKIAAARDELQLKSNNNLILKSPLPGIISDILVNESDEISETSKLLIIESMKMQNIITPQCSSGARVKKIFVKKGETIKADQVLIEFEEQKQDGN